jgi:hypothetical protein
MARWSKWKINRIIDVNFSVMLINWNGSINKYIDTQAEYKDTCI